jgi:hypothetical protein
MTDTTDRYALTLLSAAQAHKEISHNEALLRIDGLLHPSVASLGATTPPVTANAGDAWIVGTGAGGAWAQHSDEIALWQAGGWTFLKPQAGCIAWSRANGSHLLYDGSRWRGDAWPMRNVEIAGKTVLSSRQPAINLPTTGGMVDTEARNVLGQILMALRSHGLIEA